MKKKVKVSLEEEKVKFPAVNKTEFQSKFSTLIQIKYGFGKEFARPVLKEGKKMIKFWSQTIGA